MSTRQTFSLARFLFGLVVVSIACTTILLVPKPWMPHRTWWIWPFIYELALPTVGYACVFRWSRLFPSLDSIQRAIIGCFLGLVFAFGFTGMFYDCVLPIWGGIFYRPQFYESDLRSATLPRQDVRYGYHGGQLLFVVFQTSYTGQSHTEFKTAQIFDPIKTGSIEPHYDHWIELPDGTRKNLPNSRTIFEYDLGGNFISRPIDVTLDKFREWIASSPKVYSIEKLEEFARQRMPQRP